MRGRGQLSILLGSAALLRLDWTTSLHLCETASFQSVCWFEGRAVEILSTFDSWAWRQRARSGRCVSPGSLTSQHSRAPAAGLLHPLSSLFVCQVSDSQRQITDLILHTVCAWYAVDAAGDPCQAPHLAHSLEETEKATCMPMCSWMKYKNMIGQCISHAERSDCMAILRWLSFMMHVNAGTKTSFTLIK